MAKQIENNEQTKKSSAGENFRKAASKVNGRLDALSERLIPKALVGEKVDQSEVDYMTEVDAALLRRGHPGAYYISMAVAALFVLLLVWANFAVLDEVTRGKGKVVPSQRIQEIQNLEGGILQEMLVTEGQIVEKGDLLVRLDNEVAKSQFRDASNKLYENMAAVACIEAELNGAEVQMPLDVLEKAPEMAEDQINRYASRKAEFDLKLDVLRNQYQQKEQEAQELLGRKSQLEQNLSIALEQLNIAKPLMEKNVYPKVDYLDLKNKVVTLRGDIQAIRLGLPRVRNEAEEIRNKLSQQEAQYRTELLNELTELKSELSAFRETLSAGEDRVVRTELRSPVKGSVKRIMINTLGGVVRPGESILEIVPIDDSLLVEARIRPSDIAFLRPNQKAVVKITAYDYAIFGGMEGFVTQISADTIEDERGDTYYLVKLRTKGNTLRYQNEELPVITGMTAEVDILTGKKSVLDYLLKPIIKAKQNALRER
ncbi:MAG: HlyD family type I secretion periplasmic adaptor subunit [Desulfovibrionaceae bacterium]